MITFESINPREMCREALEAVATDPDTCFTDVLLMAQEVRYAALRRITLVELLNARPRPHQPDTETVLYRLRWVLGCPHGGKFESAKIGWLINSRSAGWYSCALHEAIERSRPRLAPGFPLAPPSALSE